MESFVKLFEYALGAVLFCAGAAFLLFSYKNMNETIRTIEDYTCDSVIYEQGYIQKNNYISYEQLVSVLMLPLAIDTKIDKTLYQKGTYDEERIRDVLFYSEGYECNYEYDEAGEICAICYTGVSTDQEE